MISGQKPIMSLQIHIILSLLLQNTLNKIVLNTSQKIEKERYEKLKILKIFELCLNAAMEWQICPHSWNPSSFIMGGFDF